MGLLLIEQIRDPKNSSELRFCPSTIHRENGEGPLGWYTPKLFNPLCCRPLKWDMGPNKYLLYKVYIRLMIKGTILMKRPILRVNPHYFPMNNIRTSQNGSTALTLYQVTMAKGHQHMEVVVGS